MNAELGVSNGAGTSWQEVDRELRALARRRCTIDAEEAVLLCRVVRAEVWRHCAKVSLFEYLEDVLGYGPKVARDRVRVAIELEEMPALTSALATNEQSYSAIRELTRVATSKTELAWRESARGKNLRQIEGMVVGRKKGDLPTDPQVFEDEPIVLVLKIKPATFARWRETQNVLADECGDHLDDDAMIETLCARVLDGAGGSDESRARHQILTTICDACQQGWQDGAGRKIPISAIDVARAECDAQRIGSDHEPKRAKQDVSPATRRAVFRRDHGGCRVQGCRSSRNLDVHHVVARADGGSHELENLLLLCGAHHTMLHEGTLRITGQGANVTITKHARPHVGFEPTARQQDSIERLCAMLAALDSSSNGRQLTG
ncbi:MAG: HNH endonuclease signature motif containing protein [Kofleriaceae bacterium]